MRAGLALLLAALLGGCTLIPAYHRPPLPVSNTWPATTPATGTPAADIGWRDMFKDPALQGLISLGLANNRDLRVAVLDVEQAEAQYRIDRASLLPTINGTASAEAEGIPADLSTSGSAGNFHLYSLGAGAVSWELDLFGAIRSKAAAARQSYLGAADTALSARISLVAEIASAYETWLADRESLSIATETAAADAKSVQLTKDELTHGETTALAVAQAEIAYDAALTSVSEYQRLTAEDMDELVLLAGAPIPAGLLQQMQAVSGLNAEPPIPDVPAGLPSDLLTRRPDIRAAEHALLAANANIGAARAAFFPSISLTASGGTESSSLSNLFGPGQGTWLFEPQITVPIFTAGSNLANLDLAKIEKNIEIANYEKSIQSAFHDVADALNARETYVTELQAQENLVAADTRYQDLAEMRFTTGIDSYLNLLVAQTSLLNARLTLVTLQLAARQNAITLYKALGGGWYPP